MSTLAETAIDTAALPAAAATLPKTLGEALEAARTASLTYAGGVPPRQAWALFEAGDAVLLDVRSNEERKFVGHVPGSLHVAWATGTSLTRNPRFVKEVEAKVGRHQAVLLLCRSGKRSAEAATALAKAGFTLAFNVLEGFEGDLDTQQQRGHFNGWRFLGLPWNQD